MWRSLRRVIPIRKVSLSPSERYSSSIPSGSSGKVVFGIIASTGIGFTAAILYGKYDPNFKKILEENIPYIKSVFKSFPDFFEKDQKSSPLKADSTEKEKMKKDGDLSTGLLKKKIDREKVQVFEVPKKIESKQKSGDASQFKDDKIVAETHILNTESKAAEQILESSFKDELASYENILDETVTKLKKNSEDAVNAYKNATKAVKNHTEKLYEALDLSESKADDLVWKETKTSMLDKERALKIAKQKAAETKVLIEKLKIDGKKLSDKDSSHPLVKNVEECIVTHLARLQKAESEVAAAETEAKTASEYEKLVNHSKEEFRKELQIVLPNYLGDKDTYLTEADINLLLVHAHRRIEQLQKQIAKLQVTEKFRVDQAVRDQRIQDEQFTESRIQTEMKNRHLDLESAVEYRVVALKASFESELHQQLLRQAAAHSDHLQEALNVQEQEFERKHVRELEEKLLHQKGVFVSEISGNMARLKGILDFLKAKSEFDKSSKNAQALWLACQSMNYKISLDKSGDLSPLAKDIATVKIAADEDSEYINSVLSSIPADAVNRGIFTKQTLKQRFNEVKSICRKVALVDENNDSLYKYILSYLQSFLIVDAAFTQEIDGKVAVDTSKLDTFDILSRISFCLTIDDLEQALRYANQLKGEPRTVASDWMNEVKLLLETQLAVKALLAHAAAVGVQAYH